MIGFLQGRVVHLQQTSPHRTLLTLEVNQVGYDVQVPGRIRQHLPAAPESMQLFTHLQVRDDQLMLFGFASMAERDLFRQLIAVTGIGPQLALTLIDTLGLPDLVQAIVNSNTKLLAKTPGVGTKTAERIALELRSKLAEWRVQSGLKPLANAGSIDSTQEDVEITLLALGYTTQEVLQALQTVGQNTALAKNSDTEAWIRAAIAWLSQ